MKKLVAILSCAATLAAVAGYERVGFVQIDNVDGLTAAAAKLGTLLGNPMSGQLVAGALAAAQPIKFFGPMRSEPGTSALVVLYGDAEKMASAVPAKDAMGCVLVYPMTETKAAFLKRHPGSVEKNGVIKVKEITALPSVAAVTNLSYVAFSADGKWAAKSDSTRCVKAALKDVSFAQRKMGGDVLRAYLNEKGVKILLQSVNAVQKERAKGYDANLQNILKMLTECRGGMFGVKVSGHGLDFGFRMRTMDGSELMKSVSGRLTSDPFAFVGPDALSAATHAENQGGLTPAETATFVREVLALAKNDFGVDLNPFLLLTEKGSNLRFCVDLAQAFAFVEARQKDKAFKESITKKLADKKFTEQEKAKWKNLMTKFERPLKAEGPAGSFELAIKGRKGKFSVAERFAATLPEAAQKPVSSVSFASFYSFVRELLPLCVARLSDQERTNLQPILAQLPPEAKGGIASAVWGEKKELRGVLRISADELKGLASTFSAFMAYNMMQQLHQKAGVLPGAVDDDD